MNDQVLGIVAGVLTSGSMIPQLIKTVTTKDASNLSLLIFVILIAGNSIWGYYGFLKKDIPLIAASIFAVSINAVMLFLKIKFSN